MKNIPGKHKEKYKLQNAMEKNGTKKNIPKRSPKNQKKYFGCIRGKSFNKESDFLSLAAPKISGSMHCEKSKNA